MAPSAWHPGQQKGPPTVTLEYIVLSRAWYGSATLSANRGFGPDREVDEVHVSDSNGHEALLVFHAMLGVRLQIFDESFALLSTLAPVLAGLEPDTAVRGVPVITLPALEAALQAAGIRDVTPLENPHV